MHSSDFISTKDGFKVENGRTVTQVIDQNGLIVSSIESIGAGIQGAISLITTITKLATDADDDAFTLGDGFEGQIKKIVLVTDGGGNAVITPDNLFAGATITLEDVNDYVSLIFLNGTWQIDTNVGATVA